MPLARTIVAAARAVPSVLVIGAALGAGCQPSQVGPPSVAPCDVDNPCDDGLVCDDGACIAACTPSSCGAGFCDERSGECVDCRDSNDCDPGFVCNSFTRECASDVGGCTGDLDCDRGFCETATGICVDCRDNDDCNDGQRCDAVTKSCVADQGCSSDFNCSGTTPVCEPNARVCVQCFADVHCASVACDTATRTCAAACLDNDATEPNSAGESGAAAPLASGGEHDGRICAGDVDEFSFTGAGQISASLIVDGGRLVLSLLNAQGTVVATGSTTVNVPAAAAGDYRLRVAGADADVEADYLLRLTVVAPQSCTEVDTEPNNQTLAALALPTNGSVRSGTICGSDVDFWQLSAGAGDEVTVTLVGGTGPGTPTIAIENNAGTVLASGTTQAPAVLASAPGGTIFVRVRATGGDAGYSLRATASAAPPQCVQTDPEPNDTPEQAPPAASGQLFTGQICAGDVDQWRFTAQALDDVEVALTGSNVRARVFDASGAVVGEGSSTFTIANVAAGSYRVEVKGALTTTEASYTVKVTLTPEPAADPCLEGGLEPDSAAAPRAVVTDGTVLAGRVCASDTDFYRFTLPAARTVAISVKFTHSQGDLDVRLKDAAGVQITSSAGVQNEELIIRELAAGTYLVEVFGFLGAQNTYTAQVTAINCTDDAFEPNNAAARATPVSGRAITAVRCPVNDDFYAIRLETNDTLDARLVGAGLTMSFLSSAGTVLQQDAADGADRRLQVSAQPPGRYLLRVTGAGVAAVNYTLTPAITTTPAGRCVDDGAEVNNTFDAPFVFDATVLADGSYALSSLTMCEAVINTDFYAVDVPAGRIMRVALTHATTSDLDVTAFEQRGTSGLFRSLAVGESLTGFNDVVQGHVNAATRVIIRVDEFGTMPAAGLPYTLGIELQDPPTTGCVDDRFDSWTSTDGATVRTHKNDDFTVITSGTTLIAPTSLSPPETLPSMQICAGNRDVYSFSLTAGQQFQVDVTYTHASGKDIDLRVFGPDGSNAPDDSDTAVDRLNCLTCTGVTGSERFLGTATKTGTHFVEVFGFQNSENAYQVAVTLP